jgi:hypothetical protein
MFKIFSILLLLGSFCAFTMEQQIDPQQERADKRQLPSYKRTVDYTTKSNKGLPRKCVTYRSIGDKKYPNYYQATRCEWSNPSFSDPQKINIAFEDSHLKDMFRDPVLKEMFTDSYTAWPLIKDQYYATRAVHSFNDLEAKHMDQSINNTNQ